MIMRTGILNEIGSLVCHQIDERSFSIGHNSFPLCARCTGIYTGFLVGALVMFLLRSRTVHRPLSFKDVLVSLSLLLPLIAEAIGENLHLWEVSNDSRMNIGLLGGAAISTLLLPLCGYFLGQTSAGGVNGTSDVLAVFCVLGPMALMLRCFPVLLPILEVSSIGGLFAIYLCLNLAISGAAINLSANNQRRERRVRPVLLIALVVALFIGEGAFFGLIHTRQTANQKQTTSERSTRDNHE